MCIRDSASGGEQRGAVGCEIFHIMKLTATDFIASVQTAEAVDSLGVCLQSVENRQFHACKFLLFVILRLIFRSRSFRQNDVRIRRITERMRPVSYTHLDVYKRQMQDTVGQASALTGGYANSYAQTAGQQAYNNQIQKLNDIVPELYKLAYTKYTDETKDLYNRLSALSDADQTEYDRYRDSVSDWYNCLLYTSILKNGIDVRTAYEVIHHDEIIPAALRCAVLDAEKKLANKIMSNEARPTENGSGAGAGATLGTGVSKMSKANRDDIVRRVMRGEIIRL